MEHLEIERKFLVKTDGYKNMAESEIRMVQGFLNTHPERTVRIRIAGSTALLTIKGESNLSGTTRFEWETELPLQEAKNLMNLCEPSIIEKIRYTVSFEDHIFEIDEFLGENKGLVIAEIELQHEDELFSRPSWLGKEVTGQIPYYNSQLAKKPYALWKKE